MDGWCGPSEKSGTDQFRCNKIYNFLYPHVSCVLKLSRALSSGLRSGISSYKAKLEALVGGNPDEIARVLALFENIEQEIKFY